ncbi:sugar transferase [uncultured Sphingomonas sp.]|uniref:sugar transferase n=1 Tax=uncultured Sphingomonas sp. TaxID=158754 RepID=UPI0025F47B10|nr:sugar transferase [uncultured Sphingomonas sp.]
MTLGSLDVTETQGRGPVSYSNLRVCFAAMLVATDLTCLIACFLIVDMTLPHYVLHDDGEQRIAGITLLYLLVASLTRCYSVAVSLNSMVSGIKAIRALAAAVLLFVVLGFLFKEGPVISRVMLFGMFVMGAPVLAAGRLLLAQSGPRLLGMAPWDVVVICDNVAPPPPTRNMRVYENAATHFEPHTRSPAAYDLLARTVGSADRVIVYCTAAHRCAWAAMLRGANVQGEIVTPELIELMPLGTSRFKGEPTLIVARSPLSLSQRLVKRLFDLTFASVTLLLLLPLLALIMLAVRLSSPGPILFVQPRIGRQNRQFNIYKFRTMRAELCDTDGDRATTRNDNRVTKVGHFLRSSSLDELPQLFNVLKGEMSIVGPRPHALGSKVSHQLFWEVDSRYWDRHAVKPGLTGLAQVRGFRGPTEHRSDLENRLISDLEYAHRWTVWKDCVILLRTVLVLFGPQVF